MDMNMKEYVNWKMSHDVKFGEAEGYPLVLENCRKNKDLKNFQIYGESVRDKGENLFNEETATAGVYLDDTGVEYESTATGLRLSDYIEVKPFMNYSLILTNATTSATNARISFYDTEQVFVSQTVHSISAGTSSTKNIRIPENISYVRISFAGSIKFYETVNPTNPLEIQSIGELTMKNILDMSKHTVSNGYYYDKDGGAFDTNNNMLKISPIAVEPSTTYTISSNVPVYTIWLFKGEDGTSISRIDVNKKIKTFTTTQDCTQIRVSLDLRRMVTNGVQAMSLFQWAMLEKGFGDGIYEPYNKYKYKIPVKVRGKNIYKYNVGGLTNGSIIEQLDNGAVVKGNIPSDTSDFTNSYGSGWFGPGNPSQSSSAICPIVHKGDVVTISADITLLELRKEDKYTPNIYLYSYDINDGFISSMLEAVAVNKTTRIKKTFTITSKYDNHMMYPIFPINGNIVKIENIQIEYGNTATEFESYIKPQTFNIYLDEPLRKVGDYKDYIDFEKGVVIRSVGKKVFNGTEYWSLDPSTNNNSLFYYANVKAYPNIIVSKINALSNRVKAISWTDLWQNYYKATGATNLTVGCACIYNQNDGAGNILLYIKVTPYSTLPTVTAWKNQLQTWNAEGNPFTVWYVIVPKEEAIELPKLPKTQAKTMIYEVDTSISPSNMSARYVKKH